MKTVTEYTLAKPQLSVPDVSVTEKVAAYFRSLASRGMGATSNTRSVAMFLGLSEGQVSRAKEQLVRDKRLIAKWQVWVSIDGIRFGEPTPGDEIELLKGRLRRVYRPVCDARTVTDEARVAAGKPTHLLVGDRVVSLAQALVMASEIGER